MEGWNMKSDDWARGRCPTRSAPLPNCYPVLTDPDRFVCLSFRRLPWWHVVRVCRGALGTQALAGTVYRTPGRLIRVPAHFSRYR